MPDPKAPVAPAAKAPVVPAANSPAAAPTSLAIDERFAVLAGQLMGQVEAQIEALRQEFLTQFGTNVDPLHKYLHDLLDMQTQAGARIEELEAADVAQRLDDLQGQLKHLAELVAQKSAPTIQPVVKVADQSVENRLAKIESRLRFF
jgi:hypothetical protein